MNNKINDIGFCSYGEFTRVRRFAMVQIKIFNKAAHWATGIDESIDGEPESIFTTEMIMWVGVKKWLQKISLHSTEKVMLKALQSYKELSKEDKYKSLRPIVFGQLKVTYDTYKLVRKEGSVWYDHI